MDNSDVPKICVLITGAGGFIGQALTKELLKDPSVSQITVTDITAPKTPVLAEQGQHKCHLQSVAADLTRRSVCDQLITSDYTHMYLLHGIMSGAAEADLGLGLRVNVDSMRNIVDALLRQKRVKPCTIIFPSSLAVFGPAEPGHTITEQTMPLPQSSYGAQKAMTEILLNDLSRRNLLDARIVRLPTIIVRPGAPTGAASSFCSGIFREPLNGEVGALPVRKDLKLWICSARTVIKNLMVAKGISSDRFAGGSRIVNLPGMTVTVQQMLETLLEVGGQKALNLVEEELNEDVMAIVKSWPSNFDTTRAVHLGFNPGVSLVQSIWDYLEDYAGLNEEAR